MPGVAARRASPQMRYHGLRSGGFAGQRPARPQAPWACSPIRKLFWARSSSAVPRRTPYRRRLSAAERAEVEAGRYLMLLVLSEAVAHDLPGEDSLRRRSGTATARQGKGSARPDPRRTIAAALPASSGSGDAAAARIERGQADRLAPIDAFDHLLLGREELNRGDPDKARSTFERRAAATSGLVLGALPAGRSRAQQRAPPRRRGEDRADGLPAPASRPTPGCICSAGTAYGNMGVALAAAGRNPQDGHAGRRGPGAVRRMLRADFRKALELGLEKPPRLRAPDEPRRDAVPARPVGRRRR